MINEIIEQIGGRERLEKIRAFTHTNGIEHCNRKEWQLMARALLAVLDAKPIGTVSIAPDLYSIPRRNIATVNMRPDLVLSEMRDGDNLYTTPPATSVPDVKFDLSKPGTEATVITHYQVPDGWKLVPIEPSK